MNPPHSYACTPGMRAEGLHPADCQRCAATAWPRGGDAMSDRVIEAIRERRILTTCSCGDVRREIGQHHADCLAEYRSEVEVLADAVAPNEAWVIGDPPRSPRCDVCDGTGTVFPICCPDHEAHMCATCAAANHKEMP